MTVGWPSTRAGIGQLSEDGRGYVFGDGISVPRPVPPGQHTGPPDFRQLGDPSNHELQTDVEAGTSEDTGIDAASRDPNETADGRIGGGLVVRFPRKPRTQSYQFEMSVTAAGPNCEAVRCRYPITIIVPAEPKR